MAGPYATIVPLFGLSNRCVGAPDDQLARAIDLLQRRAGCRAAELPVAMGRAALRAEAVLARAPTAFDPTTVEPAFAVDTAERVVKAASAILDLIEEEVEVLGEAFSSNLGGFGLGELLEVADAVLGVSVAPRAVPEWGDPAAAALAEVVLDGTADELRAVARSHERIYGRFTEHVWDVPVAHLFAGRRRWRFVARVRLRRELRAASRTGRVPGRLTAVTRELLEARTVRERLASLAPLLSRHLGDLDHGPLTDVDAAITAVRAVRRLQAALGDALDGGRLQQLLRADAFDSHDVTGPAANLRNALRAWVHDVESAGGADALGVTLAELARWTEECAELLPALIEGGGAVHAVGASAPTVRSLVDVLMVRERVEELLADAQPLRGSDPTWSAS